MANAQKFDRHAAGGVIAEAFRGPGWEDRDHDHIDRELSHLNYNLAPARSCREAQDMIDARPAEVGIERIRKDAVRLSTVVVTLPKDVKDGDARAFFESQRAYLNDRYGAVNEVYCWVHLDEPGARPHMHYGFTPVTFDEQKGWGLRGSAMHTKRAYRELHRGLQKAADDALGYHCSVLLDEDDKLARSMSSLGKEELTRAMELVTQLEGARDKAEDELESARETTDLVNAETARAAAELARTMTDLDAARSSRDLARKRARELQSKTDEAAERLEKLRRAGFVVEGRLDDLQRVDALARDVHAAGGFEEPARTIERARGAVAAADRELATARTLAGSKPGRARLGGGVPAAGAADAGMQVRALGVRARALEDVNAALMQTLARLVDDSTMAMRMWLDGRFRAWTESSLEPLEWELEARRTPPVVWGDEPEEPRPRVVTVKEALERLARDLERRDAWARVRPASGGGIDSPAPSISRTQPTQTPAPAPTQPTPQRAR